MLQDLALKNVGGNSHTHPPFIPQIDDTWVGNGLSAMLLVIWVFRLELNVSELGLALLSFMFAALCFLFNGVHTRNHSKSTCTDLCVLPVPG
jgi:hypothetical protein